MGEIQTTQGLDARRVRILGPDGNPVSSSNPLPVTAGHGKTLVPASGQATASGNTTIVSAPGAGVRIYVFAIYVASVNQTTSRLAYWRDGAAGSELWRHRMQTPADVMGGNNLAVTPPGYLFRLTANTALVLNLSAAFNCDYSLSYWTE